MNTASVLFVVCFFLVVVAGWWAVRCGRLNRPWLHLSRLQWVWAILSVLFALTTVPAALIVLVPDLVPFLKNALNVSVVIGACVTFVLCLHYAALVQYMHLPANVPANQPLHPDALTRAGERRR